MKPVQELYIEYELGRLYSLYPGAQYIYTYEAKTRKWVQISFSSSIAL